LCIDGACRLVCNGSKQTLCNQQCVNVQNDNNHCGSCGATCRSGRCIQGKCAIYAQQVDLSSTHTCVNTQGQLKCWGLNSYGQLGLGHTQKLTQAPKDTVEFMGKYVTQISTGSDYTCVLLDTRDLHCWGTNGLFRLGYNDSKIRLKPDLNPVPLGQKVKQVSSTLATTCVILEDGSLRCWGYNFYGQTGYGVTSSYYQQNHRHVSLYGQKVIRVSTGREHTCVILQGGSLKCWGLNRYGQLGYGDIQDRNKPTLQVIDLNKQQAVEVSVGSWHSCALIQDGYVQCWGHNMYGQLGYGDTQDRHKPSMQPIDLYGQKVTQISAGNFHTCVLLEDNSAKCWGYNRHGQLGYGDLQDRNKPPLQAIDFKGLNVRYIASGWRQTCAILQDQTVRCWGSNERSQLGHQEKDPFALPLLEPPIPHYP
ncbi:MAG: hypothetical protein AAGJ35_12260, partial [Myxococcota bacterium]